MIEFEEDDFCIVQESSFLLMQLYKKILAFLGDIHKIIRAKQVYISEVVIFLCNKCLKNA